MIVLARNKPKAPFSFSLSVSWYKKYYPWNVFSIQQISTSVDRYFVSRHVSPFGSYSDRNEPTVPYCITLNTTRLKSFSKKHIEAVVLNQTDRSIPCNWARPDGMAEIKRVIVGASQWLKQPSAVYRCFAVYGHP